MATKYPSGNYQTTASYQAIKSMQASPQEIAVGIVVYQLYNVLNDAAQSVHSARGPHLRESSVAFVKQLDKQFRLLGVRELTVQMTGSDILVNGLPVGSEAGEYARAKWLLHHLVDVGVVGVSMTMGISPHEANQFSERVATALNERTPMPDVRDLPHFDVVRTSISPEFDELLGQLVGLDRYPLLQLYGECVARSIEWSRKINAGEPPDDIEPKRLVGQIIDAFHADPGGILGLTLMRPLAGTFTNRRLDTAILATALGLSMGLSDPDAREVGVTALVRPLPGKWGPWWTRAPLSGVDAAMVALRGSSDLEIITSFECGPEPGRDMPPGYYEEPFYRHPATQLIATAEAFVDLLQPGESANPFSPDMAVQMMVAGEGSRFDAELIRALVNLVGIYPPGTPARLNSGDLVVVVAPPPPGQDLRRPTVRPFDTRDGKVFELWRPELSSYSIVDTVPKFECPANPDFVFLL